ncbi:GNAT family N-acetyltransferase [uncultured Clostridium sp.]|uniref:GNAT family N-acetyltransferase n=1 Tax=uncultured Clostridium sp. TaxID=59620 RepID=UPI0028E31FF4|nr:GNAT family N-acetyltransferase [uncultured Clostridium sp.]
MSVKSYSMLSASDREKVYDFYLRNSNKEMTNKELETCYRSEDFHFGQGVLVYFNDNNGNVEGKASLTLYEAGYKNVGYIVETMVDNHIDNQMLVLTDMIKSIRTLAIDKGLNRLLLGTRLDTIKTLIEDLGYEMIYQGIKMSLDDILIRYPLLDIIPLLQENKNQYIRIFNEAFRDTPNAGTLKAEEIERHLTEKEDDKYYYIVTDGNTEMGFLQLKLNQGMGEFDIGLLERARGQGMGKRLLETAIATLVKKGATEVTLTVISGNEPAYEMYKKRGFRIKSFISDWYEIDFDEESS